MREERFIASIGQLVGNTAALSAVRPIQAESTPSALAKLAAVLSQSAFALK